MENRNYRLIFGLILLLCVKKRHSPHFSEEDVSLKSTWTFQWPDKSGCFCYIQYLKLEIFILQRLYVQRPDVSVTLLREEVMLLGVGTDTVLDNRVDLFVIK